MTDARRGLGVASVLRVGCASLFLVGCASVFLVGCASVETTVRPTPLQDAVASVSTHPVTERPVVAIVVDEVTARARSARDERGWQTHLADALNRSEHFVAHTRDLAVARRRAQLEQLGALRPRPHGEGDDPAHQIACSVLEYEHDVRPTGGFMLGPIRSNEHLVTATVAFAYRITDARSGRAVSAGRVRATGEAVSKVTQLNIGSYDPQACDPAPALAAAEAKAIARLLLELAAVLP